MSGKSLLRCVAAVLLAETDADVETAKKELRAAMADTDRHRPPVADVEAMTKQFLVEVGCPEHLIGYPYLVFTIAEVVKNPDKHRHVTKVLYADAAKEFNTTCSRAERAIRHCVEVTNDRCDADLMAKYFGNTISASRGKPTNAEFIARVSNIIRDRMKEGN